MAGTTQQRLDALAHATKLVDEFAPRVNARGYSDGAIKPSERVELVLKVADWLLLGIDAGPFPLQLTGDSEALG